MNELKIFENEQFGAIRAMERSGEVWFVAADVCRALEHSNVTVAMERLDDDERSKFKLGRQGDTWCVNEPGLYSLVLGSRKPEAKAFKRWITHEVLPSIRRMGTYRMDMDQRSLTVDDYLRAAHITSNCRNERLPYVLGFLEQAGFSIPAVKRDESLPDADRWKRAHRYLCEWVEANRDRFSDGFSGMDRYGRFVGEYAVIPRRIFNETCESEGFSSKEILKAMKDCGILITGKKGYTKTAQIKGFGPMDCVWMWMRPAGEGAE